MLTAVERGVNAITTKDYRLKDDDFVFVEYNNRLRAKEVPLLVLTYTGPDGLASAKHEVVWGLGEMEKEIQVVVRFVLEKGA
jgi:hypothetical protein